MSASASARTAKLIGAKLGAYELTRLVGRGATASVFEGVHAMLGRRVAVKVLHEHLMLDEQITARFLREGRVAARLQHPHVVDVIDLGREGDVAWLVMEFLEGRDLRAELGRRGWLPVADAIALLLPIASALDYAHKQGALHRDLKPGNIFLARDELGRIVPKVVDFGLSKHHDLAEDEALTATETVAGSISYMAPEQTYGMSHAGAAADQFSFGAVIFECLTGRVPFTGRTFHELIQRIRLGKPRFPSQERDTVPRELDPIVLRALSSEPEARWPSVRALAAHLLPFTDAETRDAWHDEFVDAAADTVLTVTTSGPATVPEAPPASAMRTTPAERCPPLPVSAGKSPFAIKGIAYRGFVYSASRALPGGFDELVDALDDAALREFILQPFLASSRYDVLPLRPLTASLAALLSQPFDVLVEAAAAAQARYDARTVFRQMFGGSTLDDWHERAVRFGVQYYGFGRFEAAIEEPRSVVLRHTGVPEYLVPWYAPMQRGYSAETVRLLGGRDVVSETLAPQPSASVDRFDMLTTATHVSWAVAAAI